MVSDSDTGTVHRPASVGPGQRSGARAPGPLSEDYRLLRLSLWSGPIFILAFFCLWGLLGDNIPPFSPSASPAEVKQHYLDHQVGILIGMSVCLTLTAMYMVWGVATSRIMRRVDGPTGLLSRLEMMGATITCAPIMTACVIWLAAAHEVNNLDPNILHLLYWTGWLLIDLAYLVTSFEIAACSICFMRDKREKKLVPDYVSWWGWVTVVSFFVVSAIPFVTTGPLAFNGVISFWIAFFTWFFWIPGMSYYLLKAVPRLEAEEKAGLGRNGLPVPAA